MIALFTDFGLDGPYVGQMKAVLATAAPHAPVIDLFHAAPAFDPESSAYLLAAYTAGLPADAVIVAVVDPGVGGPRTPVVATAGERRYVGPDNGLFAALTAQHADARVERITWRPDRLSASFHGRDLFAPMAARLWQGETAGLEPADGLEVGADWPADRAAVVYVDRFGNAVTGLRARRLAAQTRLDLAGHVVERATTFSDRPQGQAFWYENSNGLAEIAVNQGNAALLLGAEVGTPVSVDD